MLLGDFFKITETDYSKDNSDEFNVFIELNEEHKIYKGHFPGNPIVPGVCIIQMIKEIMSELFNKKLFLNQGSNIKFISMIKPEINKMLNVNYKVKNNDDAFQLNVVISFEEKIFFKFKGILSENLSMKNE